MNFKLMFSASLGVLLLAACSDGNHRPYNLDDKFGQTQKHMVNASIANPQAAANPPADSPRKMDGYAGVNTIQTFRDSFSQHIQPQGLTINIGGASGSSTGGQ